MREIKTPVSDKVIASLQAGETVRISGYIYAGRDAVLPKVVKLMKTGRLKDYGVELEGSVIFHTAVSPAGVGPTSSNKFEIESSIEDLSMAGVKIHLGKGRIHRETIKALEKYSSAYAVIPPVTALLGVQTMEQKLIAFPELGMEALYLLKVEGYPAIIGAVHGRSIYDD